MVFNRLHSTHHHSWTQRKKETEESCYHHTQVDGGEKIRVRRISSDSRLLLLAELSSLKSGGKRNAALPSCRSETLSIDPSVTLEFPSQSKHNPPFSCTYAGLKLEADTVQMQILYDHKLKRDAEFDGLSVFPLVAETAGVLKNHLVIIRTSMSPRSDMSN